MQQNCIFCSINLNLLFVIFGFLLISLLLFIPATCSVEKMHSGGLRLRVIKARIHSRCTTIRKDMKGDNMRSLTLRAGETWGGKWENSNGQECALPPRIHIWCRKLAVLMVSWSCRAFSASSFNLRARNRENCMYVVSVCNTSWKLLKVHLIEF